jgi:biopolymer transport protein ExbD
MILFSAAIALMMQTAAPVKLDVVWDGQTCHARLDGEMLSDAELSKRGRQWASEHRSVSIPTPMNNTPYRCVGGIIFLLQEAGMQKVGFVSEPKPGSVYVSVLPGECRVAVNGNLVSFAHYRRAARKWARTQPELTFTPSPDADYGCRNRVLKVLMEAHLTKLGFLGNEMADPGSPESPQP